MAPNCSRVVPAKGSAGVIASMGRQPDRARGPAASLPVALGPSCRYKPFLIRNLKLPEPPAMAGHSHAKNIMHRKAAQGAKKAQAFGKLIREISVSAKQGLPDPAMNPRLRAAVKAALVANMTRDTIDRAIKRAAMAGQGEDYQEVRYEGYGPYGVAVIVEALTDNRNRPGGGGPHRLRKGRRGARRDHLVLLPVRAQGRALVPR